MTTIIRIVTENAQLVDQGSLLLLGPLDRQWALPIQQSGAFRRQRALAADGGSRRSRVLDLGWLENRF